MAGSGNPLSGRKGLAPVAEPDEAMAINLTARSVEFGR